MTRDEARQWSILLAAFADGKQLQKHYSDGWYDDSPVTCNSDPVEWRVKPGPKLRPWTKSEIEAECIKGTVLKGTGDNCEFGTLSRDDDGIWYVGSGLPSSPEELRDFYVIAATGAPCGVMEDA